jgi:hypothetical protein
MSLESPNNSGHLFQFSLRSLCTATLASTIRAQVVKAVPSHSIFREAARFVQTIAEGAVGGMITPSIMAARAAFGKATGAY